ncbi:MAG: hypothetical protein QW717_02085 [Candidatus Bathyarchaeia archaeon]
MVEKKTIRRIIKVSCVVQAVNAFMDVFIWLTSGFHVPSWTISTLVLGYSIILLAYDKL